MSIDNFVVDRLVRQFGQEMFDAGLEGKKMVWGLYHRNYTTEELDKLVNAAIQKICNYYLNKEDV